jgi:hypothetical protein
VGLVVRAAEIEPVGYSLSPVQSGMCEIVLLGRVGHSHLSVWVGRAKVSVCASQLELHPALGAFESEFPVELHRR